MHQVLHHKICYEVSFYTSVPTVNFDNYIEIVGSTERSYGIKDVDS